MNESVGNVILDGRIISLSAMIERLQRRFPERSREQILGIVLAENDALTGGIPVAVPAAVESGAAEVLRIATGAQPAGTGNPS